MENVKLHTEVADNFSPTLRSTIVEKTKTGVYLQTVDSLRTQRWTS